MTDTPTLAGLASELADALARIARLESMTAHPEWCVPLEAEEEGESAAAAGEVAPESPGSASPAPTDPPKVSGSQNGAEPLTEERVEAIRDIARSNIQARYALKRTLAESRKVRGLTIEQVAERMGVDAKLVQFAEQPASEGASSLETITRYATAIGARIGFSVTLSNMPLSDEPPVGTQMVDSDPSGALDPGDLVRLTADGFEWWTGSEWEATTDWLSLSHPVRLATDADRERVGLPRDQWPDAQPRVLADDEIAVKVPDSLQDWSTYYLRWRADELDDLDSKRFRLGADALRAIADSLEAKEAGE